MPQRLSKREDTSRVSPTVRRNERMRLQPPRIIQQPPGLFGPSYSAEIGPERTNHDFLAPDAYMPRARVIDPHPIPSFDTPSLFTGAPMRNVRPEVSPISVLQRAQQEERRQRRQEAHEQNTVRNELNLAPMLMDHNVLSHARNAAPMQTVAGREGALAAERLIRTTSPP